MFISHYVLDRIGYRYQNKLNYSKKLEEQTFDIRFFSVVRILGIYVFPGETSTSQNTRKFVALIFWSSVHGKVHLNIL